MKKCRKILASVMAITMMMSVTTVSGCLGGAREISSIVVTTNSVDTTYTLNEAVNFEGMVITAKFNDASTEPIDFKNVKVYLNNEDITNDLNKITASIGTKTVVIEYEGKRAELIITVSSAVDGGGEGSGNTETPTTVIVAGYEAPAAYTEHLSKKNAGGTLKYGDEGYEAQFMTGGDMLVAGDDNAFKFLPTLRFLNADNQPETAVTFKSVTTVSLFEDGAYASLDSRAGADANIVEYFSGDDVYLTADVTNNTYDFAEIAIGKQFKLSVLPGSNYVYPSKKAVEGEVSVVDGFNVYTAKQLSLIDNDTERTDWNDIKEAESLVGVDPAAIVIQNDINVTANDLPAAMQYTLDQEVVYYREADAATKANPIAASNQFLYDGTDIFRRTIGEGQSFKVYGNYFNLSLANVPLVCSFVNEYEMDGYGADGSNSQLFKIEGTGSFSMNNLDVKGNANISDQVYVTEDGKNLAVYAGGLIFLKSQGCTSVLDNILTRTNFIAFFPDGENGNFTIKNCKAYDSYANASYVWAKNTMSIENCDMARAGGPLILANHAYPEDGDKKFPTVTADEKCTFKNFVTGKEFWFNSYGAGAIITQLRALNVAFAGDDEKGIAGLSRQLSTAMTGTTVRKSFLDDLGANGKINMIYVLMPNGTDPTTLVLTPDVEGSFAYKGYELNRTKGTVIGESVHGVFNMAFAQNQPGVSFNCKDSFGYYDGTTVQTLDGDMTKLGNFATPGESYVTVNLGAFSVFMEYFDIK